MVNYLEPEVKTFNVRLVDRMRFLKEDSYSGPEQDVYVRAKNPNEAIDLFLLNPFWMGIEARRVDDLLEWKLFCERKEPLVN